MSKQQDLIDVEMPDGTVVSGVPAGTSQAEVLRRFKLSTPAEQPPVQQSDDRSAGQVATDQFSHVVSGVGQAVTGIPGMIAGIGGLAKDALTGNASAALDKVKGMATGAVQPLSTVTRGAAALAAPDSVAAPSRQEFEGAAEGAGQNLGNLALGEVTGKIAPSLVDRAKALRNPNAAMERTLLPGGKGSTSIKGIAQSSAPDLVAAGEKPAGLFTRQKARDLQFLSKFENAKAQLNAAEQSIPAGTKIPKQPIIDQLDKAISDLQVPGGKQTVSVPAYASDASGNIFDADGNPFMTTEEQTSGPVTMHPDAVRAITDIRTEVAKLPDQVPFANMRKLRQDLDKAIADSNGWSETAATADRAALKAKRQAAGIIRDNLKGISTEMDTANREFSLYADPAQIIKYRQLQDVAKPTLARNLLKKYGPPLAVGALAGHEMWKGH